MLERLLRSRTFARVAQRAFIGNLKQVTRFLTDQRGEGPGAGARPRRDRRRHAGTDWPFAGVSGRVRVPVPYQPPSVELLVTLGSPLGIPNVVFDRLTPAPAGGQGAWPGPSASWVNVADPDDIVALHKQLAGLFAGPPAASRQRSPGRQRRRAARDRPLPQRPADRERARRCPRLTSPLPAPALLAAGTAALRLPRFARPWTRSRGVAADGRGGPDRAGLRHRRRRTPDTSSTPSSTTCGRASEGAAAPRPSWSSTTPATEPTLGGTTITWSPRNREPATSTSRPCQPRTLPKLLTRRDDKAEPIADQPTVLVILDCCYSGSGGMEMLGDGLREIGNPNTWVIASASDAAVRPAGVVRRRRSAMRCGRPRTGLLAALPSLDSLVQAINEPFTATPTRRPGSSRPLPDPRASRRSSPTRSTSRAWPD